MSLSSHLDDPKGPLSVFMSDRFPTITGVQKRYREGAPGLRFHRPPGINPGTLGTAIDWRVRFVFDPRPDAHLAIAGAHVLGSEPLLVALMQLVSQAGMRVVIGRDESVQGGPLPVRDADLLPRLCWVLALFAEVFRAGFWPSSPLASIGDAASPDRLLELAPAEACRDIEALAEAAHLRLGPVVAERGGELSIGPTFAGSHLVGGADADLCAGGLLVDVKTTAGTKRASGQYGCALERLVLRQLLGYVLLDFDDRYGIDSVGLYSARYDYFVAWELDHLLAEIGGPGESLDRLRGDFQAVVTYVAGATRRRPDERR